MQKPSSTPYSPAEAAAAAAATHTDRGIAQRYQQKVAPIMVALAAQLANALVKELVLGPWQPG